MITRRTCDYYCKRAERGLELFTPVGSNVVQAMVSGGGSNAHRRFVWADRIVVVFDSCLVTVWSFDAKELRVE